MTGKLVLKQIRYWDLRNNCSMRLRLREVFTKRCVGRRCAININVREMLEENLHTRERLAYERFGYKKIVWRKLARCEKKIPYKFVY